MSAGLNPTEPLLASVYTITHRAKHQMQSKHISRMSKAMPFGWHVTSHAHTPLLLSLVSLLAPCPPHPLVCPSPPCATYPVCNVHPTPPDAPTTSQDFLTPHVCNEATQPVVRLRPSSALCRRSESCPVPAQLVMSDAPRQHKTCSVQEW